ncbi:MAG: RNA polymerase sigma factor, partial [Acidobacteria bacterium]|nr:RNA polymerase sigma factor [Acidobacteriota bacterium]
MRDEISAAAVPRGRPRALDPEEQEWIRRCRNGSRRAYEPLVRRYAQWAQVYAYRRVGDREEARDLAQEAFARAFHAMPRFRLGRPFLPWFLTILDNLCRSYLRRRRPEIGLDHVPEPASDGGMRSIDQRILLERGLAGLSEDQRRVVVMRDVEGYVHREVAERLGIP